jgi:hypothetical protein
LLIDKLDELKRTIEDADYHRDDPSYMIDCLHEIHDILTELEEKD